MSSFYDQLFDVLQADPRLVADDGTFLRNAAFELGYKGDADLFRLLLSNPTTKDRFFDEVDDVLIFDKQEFGWVVANREFLPDSYTRFKNTIGLVDRSGTSLGTGSSVELVWPFKDCFLEGGQEAEDEKRDEIFYNQTLAPDEVDRLLDPKVLTGATRYSTSGVEEVCEFNDNDNLFIRGNNLLALSSLLCRYRGQVQLIYIDPPFNTGNDDFLYNDRFNMSTWLTFMRNRLELAKELLSDS